MPDPTTPAKPTEADPEDLEEGDLPTDDELVEIDTFADADDDADHEMFDEAGLPI